MFLFVHAVCLILIGLRLLQMFVCDLLIAVVAGGIFALALVLVFLLCCFGGPEGVWLDTPVHSNAKRD